MPRALEDGKDAPSLKNLDVKVTSRAPPGPRTPGNLVRWANRGQRVEVWPEDLVVPARPIPQHGIAVESRDIEPEHGHQATESYELMDHRVPCPPKSREELAVPVSVTEFSVLTRVAVSGLAGVVDGDDPKKSLTDCDADLFVGRRVRCSVQGTL